MKIIISEAQLASFLISEAEFKQIIQEAEEELILQPESLELLKDIARLFGNGYVRWMSNLMKKDNLKEEDIYKYMDFFNTSR